MERYISINPKLIERSKSISSSGIRIMIEYVIPNTNKDFQVYLRVSEIANQINYSPATIYRAIQNLLKAKIIANTKWDYIYQVLPGLEYLVGKE